MTPTPTPPPPETFDRETVEREIVRLINERRERENRSQLDANGSIAEQLQRMARNYSDTMADEGVTRYELDGRTSTERYKDNDLYHRCQWVTDTGSIVTADDHELEAIGSTWAGKPYSVGDGEALNRNETEVARAIVDRWFGGLYGEQVLREGADEIGVGVVIVENGEVYVTANLCGETSS